jgi:hypothetical protein
MFVMKMAAYNITRMRTMEQITRRGLALTHGVSQQSAKHVSMPD